MGFIKKLRHRFVNLKRDSDKKRLIENFFSLSILQGANYLLPLVTLPYLTRVLGPEKFGLIAFAQAFIFYFIVITDYSFNLTASREISINRDQQRKVSEIFCSVILIKSVLMFLTLLFLIILMVMTEKFGEEWIVYSFAFGMVIGHVLFPLWFFQGIEKMRYIAILNILAKSIYTISIFIFIRRVEHYKFVPLLNSFGFITTGVMGIVFAIKKFNVKLLIPSLNMIKINLKEGWHIFVSYLSSTLFTSSNVFLLGLFTNDTYVGYFAAGEKLIRAITHITIPVSNTIFPHVSQLLKKSKKEAFQFLRKIAHLGGSLFLLVSLFTFIFAPMLVTLIFGMDYLESILVLRILTILPVSIFLDNIFGAQILVNLKKTKIILNISIISGFLSIMLLIILIPPFKHVGASISVLVTQLFIAVTTYYYARKQGFNLFNSR